jgi:hypothetical protein
MTGLQVPFGRLPDGQIVTVETVGRGLDCGCACPECGERLVAAKGEVYRHHFRHVTDSDCHGGPETFLHIFAKQILVETRTLQMPGGHMHTATTASAEHRLECGLIPDVWMLFSEPVAIEIWVAHRVPPEKVHTYNEEKIAALEIDLRAYRNAGHSKSEWAFIIREQAPRRWLSPTARIRQKREEQRLAEIAEHQRIRQEAERIEREAVAAIRAAIAQEEAARAEREKAAAEQRALDQAEAALRLAEETLRLERRRGDDARRLAIAKQREIEEAIAAQKEADYRRAILEQLAIDRRGPDLQQLVIAHGGYDRITPEAWKLFDHDRKTWQDRIATGWFYGQDFG